jgi:nitroreductase
MVAARAVGLDTCPQVSFARFQNVIAEHLELPPGFEVVCGMSLGWSDCDSPLGNLEMKREPVQNGVHHGTPGPSP